MKTLTDLKNQESMQKKYRALSNEVRNQNERLNAQDNINLDIDQQLYADCKTHADCSGQNEN